MTQVAVQESGYMGYSIQHIVSYPSNGHSAIALGRDRTLVTSSPRPITVETSKFDPC